MATEITFVKAPCGSNACVEVGRSGNQWHVRDSKDPSGPVLTFSQEEWSNFVAGIHAGTFELLP